MQRFTYWRYLQYAPLLLAFLLIGLITAYRRESTQSDGVATPLAIDSPFLSLGKVPAIQNFKWKAELRNASKYDLNVERFDASCTCVSISPHKATIPSGGKCMLDLTLDFSNIVVQGGENVTHHEFALVPVIKGARRSGTEFVFKSIVVPAFTVSPPRISRVGYDALTYSTQPVSIHAEVALLREDITLSAISRPPVSDTTFHDTNDRRIKSMHIGFPPGLCGTHSFHIDIDAADARGQSVARMSIPVFVEVVGPLLIRPAHPVIQYSSQSHPEKLVTLPRLDALTTTEGVEVINARSADSRLIITRLSERDAHGNAAFSVQAPAGQYIKAAIEFCYSINGIALPSMVDATPIEFVPVNAHASRLPAEEY